MRILITGINGFAGSHLLDYIIANENAEIFGIVRDKNETRNIKNHLGRIQLQETDISDSARVSKIVATLKPDKIFHLAGVTHAHSLQQNASASFSVNIMGAVNVLESVRSSQVSTRVLIVSSGYTYGGLKNGQELPDENSALRPTDPYSASKASVDHISQMYRAFYGMDVVIARPFNHTGPRQDVSFVASAIAKQFAEIQGKRAKNLRMGNVESRRDFTDVRDVVRGYWLMSGEKKQDFVFNVSSGSTFSVKDIIRMLEEISGVHPDVEVDSTKLRKSDLVFLAGNSNRLRSSFGWKPEIQFARTLRDLYEYHLNQMPS